MPTESSLMLPTVTFFLVFTILALAIVLAREIRLRRALERLLRRLLARFYSHKESGRESKPPDAASTTNDDAARRL